MQFNLTSLLTFFTVCLTITASQEVHNEPYLKLLLKQAIFNIGDIRAVYCQGFNLKEDIVWLAPSGDVVERRANKRRVHTEPPKKDGLIPLIFETVQLSDTGNWTCKSGDLSEIFVLEVVERVNITNTRESLNYEEGTTVKLECPAKGIPEPTVNWYKNGVNLFPFDERKYSIRKKEEYINILEIRRLNHTDSAEYNCKAIQAKISHFAEKIIQLNVLHRPLLLDSQSNLLVQQYNKSYKVTEVYAIMNEMKNITCKAIAYPKPTYRWFKKQDGYEAPIPTEDTIYTAEDGSSSVLVLRMYNSSYLAEYVCSVNNTKGVVSMVYHVSLGEKPAPPDSLTYVTSSVDSMTFNVNCSKCQFESEEGVPSGPNNLIVEGFTFQFKPVLPDFADTDWENPISIDVNIVDGNCTLEVGPLPNNTAFFVRVASRNAAGISTWLTLEEHPTTNGSTINTVSKFLVIFLAILITLCNED